MYINDTRLLNKKYKLITIFKTYEWMRWNQDNTVTLGITNYAQSLLDQVVFIFFPPIGHIIYHASEECILIESIKVISDIYAPIPGKVVAINKKLLHMPTLVNTDPYQSGWIIKIHPFLD